MVDWRYCRFLAVGSRVGRFVAVINFRHGFGAQKVESPSYIGGNLRRMKRVQQEPTVSLTPDEWWLARQQLSQFDSELAIDSPQSGQLPEEDSELQVAAELQVAPESLCHCPSVTVSQHTSCVASWFTCCGASCFYLLCRLLIAVC